VVKLRSLGWSGPRIAEKLKVDESTVRADLTGSGNPEPAPTRVTGKDGKSYPAKRPEPAPTIFARDKRWERGSVPDAPDGDNAGSRVMGRAWPAAMQQAGAVLDWLPELLPAIAPGEVALDAAPYAGLQ